MTKPKLKTKRRPSNNFEGSHGLLHIVLCYVIISGVIIFSLMFVARWWLIPVGIVGGLITLSTVMTFHQIQQGNIDVKTFKELMFENLKRSTMTLTLADSVLNFFQSSAKSNKMQNEVIVKKNKEED